MAKPKKKTTKSKVKKRTVKKKTSKKKTTRTSKKINPNAIVPTGEVWSTGFGMEYEVLSCGCSRKVGNVPRGGGCFKCGPIIIPE